MTASSLGSLAAAVLLVAAGAVCEPPPNAARGEPHFVAAYFNGGAELYLFPLIHGKETAVALPPGLLHFNLISFAPDAKSAYLQDLFVVARHHTYTATLVQIEFGPIRKSVVPGSTGLSIASLTVSRSGKIFVSAGDDQSRLCGAYEIDPAAGTHRPLRIGPEPDCAGAIGEISPDGKRVLSSQSPPRPGNAPVKAHLTLLDLATGATQSLGEGRGTWSPDGRRIAVAGGGQIVVMDAANLSHRKKLGSSGVDDNLVWSPDSKRLLFVKQEWRCGDDTETLETVDVETGRRSVIGSSHCGVTSSAVGWVDPQVVR